jgi:hypothetical protein
MGFDVRFKFPRVLGHPGAAHQLSMLFKHPHIIGVDLVGAVASWIALWLFGHRRGRCSRGSIWRRLARWDRPCLRWLPTRARIRVLDGRKTIPPWSVLHWLFSSWWWSSPARRASVAQVPGELAKTSESWSGSAKQAFPLRLPIRVRVAAPVPFRAELLAPVQACPRAQTVHLGGEASIQRVEEELVAWAPGSALALMVRSHHQGQLKMR